MSILLPAAMRVLASSRQKSMKWNFSGAAKYSLSSRKPEKERAGQGNSASSGAKPTACSVSGGRAPQRAHADIVVSFLPTESEDPAKLDAHVILRGTLKHPDLSPVLGPGDEGPALVRRADEVLLRIPGDTDPDLAAELEEAVWQRMRYASRLRSHRLGEFTVGTELHRSESLALVQTLLVYHLVSTRATIDAGEDPHIWHPPRGTGADSALHA